MSHRVLLADDHSLVRAGLRALLEHTPNIEVIGETGNGGDALRLIGELHPDLVLMDISLPDLNGLEVTRRAARLQPRPRILMVSMHTDKEYVRQSLRVGAGGYLVKNSDRRDLESAIAAVIQGELWISPSILQGAEDVFSAFGRLAHGTGPLEALTPRQREVLRLIAEGHSTRRIASRLKLSVKTVETHRAQIMVRLGTHHVAGLVRYAIRMGLVPAEK